MPMIYPKANFYVK